MVSDESTEWDNDLSRDLFSDIMLQSQILKAQLPADYQSIDCDPITVLSDFKRLSLSEQKKYASSFNSFVDVISQHLNRSPMLDQSLVWYMLRRMGLRPPSNLFELIGPDDYVEIYDRSGIQVFRNLKFCLLISYSIHEILMHPWNKLYARSKESSQQIAIAFEEIFKQKRILTNLGVDPHLAWQTAHGTKRVFHVDMKYFAPLYSSNRSVDYMLAGSVIKILLE